MSLVITSDPISQFLPVKAIWERGEVFILVLNGTVTLFFLFPTLSERNVTARIHLRIKNISIDCGSVVYYSDETIVEFLLLFGLSAAPADSCKTIAIHVGERI